MELDLSGLVLPERVEVVHRSEDGRAAEFVMAPLERGFGHTLGNTVRRILLSSLPGAAVWAFRMDGVVHEHQTVEGVVEDIHQIIQNLKTLVLEWDGDLPHAVQGSAPVADEEDDFIVQEEVPAPVTLELRVDKAGPVTAEAMGGNARVQVVNQDHHLFTLQDDREINLTLYVNRGRGFVAADQHRLPKGSPVDLVRIDSIYNPVLRANFTVEETRVGQRTDFDRLTLLVETNGSRAPEEAVAHAAELARRHFAYLLQFGGIKASDPPAPGAVRMSTGMQDLFQRPIEDLTELSVRSVNSLKKESIVTLGDLVRRTEQQMLNIENFGQKSLEEIRRFLEDQDLRFGMQLEAGEDGELYLVGEDAEAEQPATAED
ncbi:MAG TPA: DNA-directed RNA polymerase subunit alpha [Longimicrobiales bacterium]|nr:DNA-directed RNA polymerase subunit alpha [Longimicrobiales bacterium]